MKNKEILKKAIEKIGYRSEHTDEYLRIIDDINIVKTATEVIYLSKRINELVYIIIFSHDFIKALCGNISYYHKNEVDEEGIFKGHKRSFEYHLQMMVIKKNPIKYLEQFL